MITNTAGSRLNVREEPRRQSATVAKVSEGAIYEFRGGKKGDQVQDDVNPKLISDAWAKIFVPEVQKEGFVSAIYTKCSENEKDGVLLTPPVEEVPPAVIVEPVDATPSSPGGPLNAPGKKLVAVSHFIKPIEDGYIISGWRFGETGAEGGHLGLDVFTKRGSGTPVRAIADGEIALITTGVGDYIDVVVVRHRVETAVGPNFSEYIYSAATHVNMARGLYLGKSVKQGEELGTINNRLSGGQPHTHFVMYDHEYFLRGLQSPACRVSNGCPPRGYSGNNFGASTEFHRYGSFGYVLNPENFFSIDIKLY